MMLYSPHSYWSKYLCSELKCWKMRVQSKQLFFLKHFFTKIDHWFLSIRHCFDLVTIQWEEICKNSRNKAITSTCACEWTQKGVLVLLLGHLFVQNSTFSHNIISTCGFEQGSTVRCRRINYKAIIEHHWHWHCSCRICIHTMCVG